MYLHKYNKKRKRELNSIKTSPDGPVLYLMSRDQRVSDNWALVYAQNQAIKKEVPVIVSFVFNENFTRANKRHNDFMIKGLKEVEKNLNKKNINFFIRSGKYSEVIKKLNNEFEISEIIIDFAPTRGAREWRTGLAKEINVPVVEVDAHNIIPAWVLSNKQEYAAYTIRKKVDKNIDEFLELAPEVIKHPYTFSSKSDNNWGKINKKVGMMPGDVANWIKPGENAAIRTLDSFIKERLHVFDKHRNNPNKSAISNLSPYFHFGQLSANLAVHTIIDSNASQSVKNAFFEQVVVRKELSDNYCLYNKKYDSFGGFPDWAKKTLDDHRNDKREYLYSEEQFENAKTHDDLWNAAQMEMVKKGKMHGYMRMYWAKKILEWSKSPEEAQHTAIYLNDKYELDGRDPNGYAGIAWAIGGVHDRPWPERKIFGKVRYMNYNGAKRKFDVRKYIDDIDKF